MKRIDLSGQQFGQLRVLGPASLVKRHLRWNCFCVCGAECQVSGEALRRGTAISCGCIQRRGAGNTSHGLNIGRRHPLSGTWSGLRQRCYNPKASRFNRYGARGIKVCDRWLNGADGNWALDVEQARNRLTTVEVDLDGERVSLAEYCERKGLTYKIVHQRLSRGWSLEKASTYPVTMSRGPMPEARL